MGKCDELWIGAAGTLPVSSVWRNAEEDDIALLHCWFSLNPQLDSGQLRIASYSAGGEWPEAKHHQSVTTFCRQLTSRGALSLIYLHRLPSPDCKTPLLPELLYNAGHFNEVLGLKMDDSGLTWSHLQLAGAMVTAEQDCLLIVDALSRFSSSSDTFANRVDYLLFTHPGKILTTGGWRWIRQPSADHPASETLDEWLTDKPRAAALTLRLPGEPGQQDSIFSQHYVAAA
ncbi:hypothetical protein [Brenneria uluponensis]|uniref:hypothetical protein n=1 Tax=Brenneria uluponensis TaxID=3057057 RepID=UPI0028E1DA03|nr:hypothetical protein [Brenneria ulupoensis]